MYEMTLDYVGDKHMVLGYVCLSNRCQDTKLIHVVTHFWSIDGINRNDVIWDCTAYIVTYHLQDWQRITGWHMYWKNLRWRNTWRQDATYSSLLSMDVKIIVEADIKTSAKQYIIVHHKLVNLILLLSKATC